MYISIYKSSVAILFWFPLFPLLACVFGFRLPVRLRQPCSTGKCLRSCVAPHTWPVTPVNLWPLELWMLPLSAAPVLLSFSPNLEGTERQCNCKYSDLNHKHLVKNVYSVFFTDIYTCTSPVSCQCEMCSLMLILPFAGLNPDILRANLNFLPSCCSATSTASYVRKVYLMKGIQDACFHILYCENVYYCSNITEIFNLKANMKYYTTITNRFLV